MKQTPYRTAKVIRPYSVKAFGYDIVIPVGSTVSNSTGTTYGNDDSYHFWEDFRTEVERLTGFENSTLVHDLTYHEIDVPAEYCSEWTPAP